MNDIADGTKSDNQNFQNQSPMGLGGMLKLP